MKRFSWRQLRFGITRPVLRVVLIDSAVPCYAAPPMGSDSTIWGKAGIRAARSGTSDTNLLERAGTFQRQVFSTRHGKLW